MGRNGLGYFLGRTQQICQTDQEVGTRLPNAAEARFPFSATGFAECLRRIWNSLSICRQSQLGNMFVLLLTLPGEGVSNLHTLHQESGT
jgi:hypothetical protein